jgi:hypothetical protein
MLGGAIPVAFAAAQVSSKSDRSKLSMPGLYRGRVVQVEHPGSIVAGQYQAEPVRDMMRRGMTNLTGADGWVDAWRLFVEPGDVVGISESGGMPHVISRLRWCAKSSPAHRRRIETSGHRGLRPLSRSILQSRVR